MSHADPANDPRQRARALSRWDNEGGATPAVPLPEPRSGAAEAPMPANGPAELGALHIRVIALENLVIALLATASDEQRAMAREMAGYISPRSGFTRHPLTIHAADHMVDLVERADRFTAPAPAE
jgi:hypothetical protein